MRISMASILAIWPLLTWVSMVQTVRMDTLIFQNMLFSYFSSSNQDLSDSLYLPKTNGDPAKPNPMSVWLQLPIGQQNRRLLEQRTHSNSTNSIPNRLHKSIKQLNIQYSARVLYHRKESFESRFVKQHHPTSSIKNFPRKRKFDRYKFVE